jgi:hypothetical protein
MTDMTWEKKYRAGDGAPATFGTPAGAHRMRETRIN